MSVLRHGPVPDHRPADGVEGDRAALRMHAARPAGLPGGTEDLPPRGLRGQGSAAAGGTGQESLARPFARLENAGAASERALAAS